MLHQLTITCDYPAQLIGFHMQNCTDDTKLTFNALVPIEDSEEALYAWGTPEDASDVQHRHSDAGYCIYRFETPLPPLEWLETMRVFYPLLTFTLISYWFYIASLLLRSICLRVGPLRTRFPPLLTPLGIPGMLKSSFSSSFCNGSFLNGRGNRCLR